MSATGCRSTDEVSSGVGDCTDSSQLTMSYKHHLVLALDTALYNHFGQRFGPNLMAFMQHYQWTTPETPEMVNAVPFGDTTDSPIQGLFALNELLEIGNEREVRKSIHLAEHAAKLQ